MMRLTTEKATVLTLIERSIAIEEIYLSLYKLLTEFAKQSFQNQTYLILSEKVPVVRKFGQAVRLRTCLFFISLTKRMNFRLTALLIFVSLNLVKPLF